MKTGKDAVPSSAAGGSDEGDGHAVCRARLAAAEATEGELRARLAAAEATAFELRAANEALAGEKEEIEEALASAEAEKGELRARLAALGGGSSSSGLWNSVPVNVELCPFLARRRDFGAELPAGVLLIIMDRAPSSRCLPLKSLRGRHVQLHVFY